MVLTLRLIWAETRRSHAFWLLPLLIAAGVWFAVEYSRVDMLFWDQVSANIALTFVLIGPACSGWGAWLAGREARRRLTELLSASPTSSVRRDAVVFGAPVIGALVAYALVALIVGGYTATHATWGGPAWAVIAFGAVVTAAMALCGAILGRVWPARITPFVALFGPLFYTTLTYSYFKSWDGQRWLAPYAYIMDWKQHPLNVLVDVQWSPYRGSLIGGTLAACGVVLLAYGLMVAARRQWRVSTLVGVLAVVLLVSGWEQSQTAFVDTAPGSYIGPQPVVNPPLSCAGDVVTTCLHKVYEPELSDAAARIDALFAPIVGLPGVPERVEQRADLESTEMVLRFDAVWTFDVLPQFSAASDLLWPTITGWSDVREDRPLDAPQHVISRWLVIQAGYDAYYANSAAEIEDPFRTAAERRPADSDSPAVYTVPEDAMNAYFDELAAYNLDLAAAAERFAMLPADEQRAWLEANWAALRSGELTLKDLP